VRANADGAAFQTLFDKDEVSRQRLDQAIATARTANAQVEAAQQKVSAMEAQITRRAPRLRPRLPTLKRAESQVGAARAQVNEALAGSIKRNTAPQQVAVSEAQASSAGANLQQLQAGGR